jgi:hypothetical protein
MSLIAHFKQLRLRQRVCCVEQQVRVSVCVCVKLSVNC